MKTNRLLTFFLAVLFIGTVSSCRAPGRILGNGNVIEQERSVRGFTGVELNGAANVNIHQSADFNVIVSTDSNIQNRIETRVRNNILRIVINANNIASGGFVPTKLTIDIYMPELTELNVNGAATVNVSGGKASNLKINLNGAATINAQDYEVNNVDVSLSGAGDVKTWAVNELNYQISGVGTIRYRGNPALSGRTNGLGKVNRL